MLRSRCSFSSSRDPLRIRTMEIVEMTRVARDFCFVALTFLLTTAAASAQLATAELNGRVTDSSGAVLPGVTVTATQTATGLVRTVTTDGEGNYLISNLPTGPYRLEVSLQGFKSHVQ